MKTLEQLAGAKAYPGRFLILGNNAQNLIAVYGVTARSTAKPLKRYVFSPTKDSIHVEPLDPEAWTKVDRDLAALLDYTAVRFFDNGLVIGNGRQTDSVKELNNPNATNQLSDALQTETFEPDKYSTPRITGCISHAAGQWTQALHIIRNDGVGSSTRDVFPLTTTSDTAQFISVYAGPNIRPTPSFSGGPIEIAALPGHAKQIAEQVYAAFAPASGQDDLRVSVIAICLDRNTRDKQVYIINTADKS